MIVSANTYWNIRNFRERLLAAIADRGYQLIIAVPDAANREPLPFDAEVVAIRVDRGGLNPVRDFLLFLGYLRLMIRYRPVAALGFTVKPNLYGALAARLAGVSFIANVSGLGTAFIGGGLLQRLVTSLYRLCFRRCHIVFFQNPDDRNLFLAERLVRPAQARLLPGSGIDLDHFRPLTEPSADRSGKDPTFLFIGRLLRDKGVEEYIAAAGLVRGELPGARFQLLGPLDGDNRSAIGARQLASLCNRGTVDYLGAAADVRPHIAAASAIVLPSYREGLPRSLLEGAAMARPLIATDVPGNREIVEDGVTGLMCKAGDAQSLADAMSRFARLAPQQRAALGLAGRARVEARFSDSLVIEAYLDALQRSVPISRWWHR